MLLIMPTIEDYKQAIRPMFLESPPRREVNMISIVRAIAYYFHLPESEIVQEDLLAALRETPGAFPRYRQRGSGYVAWVFVKQSGDQTTGKTGPAAKKARQYRDKPLAESLKLKRS
jgi:hypothetical protein